MFGCGISAAIVGGSLLGVLLVPFDNLSRQFSVPGLWAEIILKLLAAGILAQCIGIAVARSGRRLQNTHEILGKVIGVVCGLTAVAIASAIGGVNPQYGVPTVAPLLGLTMMATIVLGPMAHSSVALPPLIEAVTAGDDDAHIAAATALLDSGADMNAVASNGTSALMIAAAAGHVRMTRLLLERGADVNVWSRSGSTPLMLAAATGSPATLTALLESGADIHGRSLTSDLDALNMAIVHDRLENVRVLIEAGGASDTEGLSNSLMMAAFGGRTEMVKILLDSGLSVNRVHAVSTVDTGPREVTALMIAAGSGHLETVRALLEGGADVNLKTSEGWTALMLASGKFKDPNMRPRPDVVKLLEQFGAIQ